MSKIDFISKLSSLTESEIKSLLENDFSSEELISLLEELLLLDPKLEAQYQLFDCCGTGGDKANSFNISTVAAIIASACDTKVCKNGGRSSSSKTGSVDVLESLGVNLNLELNKKMQTLEKQNLAFHNSKIIAETLSPLKNYARQNKISSFLSLLGPFTNPFILEGQIIGVGKEEWFEKISELAKHSIKKGYVKKIFLVQSQSNDGQILDELTSVTKAKLRLINQTEIIDMTISPKDFKFSPALLESIKGGDSHKESAEILKSVITNNADKCKIETSLINAALLIFLKNWEHQSENIKIELQEKYNLAKSRLSDNKVQENWQNFLDHNTRY